MGVAMTTSRAAATCSRAWRMAVSSASARTRAAAGRSRSTISVRGVASGKAASTWRSRAVERELADGLPARATIAMKEGVEL